MCDFVSGIITRELPNPKILIWDLISHAETEKHFKLEPDSYNEWEWVYPDTLTIRVKDGDDETAYRACLLADYKNYEYLLSHLPADVIVGGPLYRNGCTGLSGWMEIVKALPANLKSKLTKRLNR